VLSSIEDINLAHKYCQDDPVRPHIPCSWRIEDNRIMYAMYEDQYAEYAEPLIKTPLAILCVAFTNEVPTSEEDLMRFAEVDNPSIAVFYTVWSYHQGAGRQIINDVQNRIHKDSNGQIMRYVTLSPLTRIAERFHIRNGATKLAVHETCQNFEYPQPK